MGGEDSGYLSGLPTLSPRQSALSYRDSVLCDDFVRQRLQFPISSIMTHGIIRGKFNLLGGEKESRGDWRDEIVHYVSVGNMMTELYITPELLDRQEWDDLAATLSWAQANQHPLPDNTTMVLGDPARREPYGFVHASPEKVIVTLRNPFANPRLVHLRLDESSGFSSSDKHYRLVTIYPFHRDEAGRYGYGDSLDTDLGAFEQRVLELIPESESSSRLYVSGARYSVEESGDGNAIVHLYAPAGAKQNVEITGNRDEQHRFEIDFGKTGQKESAVMNSSPVLEIVGPQEVRVRMRMQIPEDVPKTTVALLFEPQGQTAEITAKASDNGAPASLNTENGKGVWQWFSLVLKPGTHALQFTIDLPSSLTKGGKLSAWAISEKQLAERTIPVKLAAGSGVVSASKSLPAENDVEKTTLKLMQRAIQ